MPFTRKQALERLKALVAYDKEPTLTGVQLEQLLDAHARAGEWTAETAYVIGDRIVTTDRNGRLYRCVTAGESDTEEPDWGNSHYAGRELGDGEELVWRDEGPAFRELYDLNASAQAGWLLKAAAAADLIQTSDRDQTLHLEQVQQNCIRMARTFQPVFIA